MLLPDFLKLHVLYVPAYLSAFLLTVTLILLLTPFSEYLGLLDEPDARKLHQRNTPLIGGIAMMLAIAVVVVQFETMNAQLRHSLLAMLIVVVTGILDDRHDIRPRYKFASQCAAALVVILMCNLKVTHLGNLFGFGEVTLPSPLAELMTVVCIVGVINAINMADGLDGLAGGLFSVCALAFAYVALSVGNAVMLNLALIALAAVLAFLLFNLGPPLRPHALVFMGDAGSMLLGLLLTLFAIHITAPYTPGQIAPIVAVWIIGVPLMDMASVMLRRYRRQLRLTAASNLHLHHMLLKVGYTRPRAALIKVLLTALMAACGVLAWRLQVPDYVLFYGFLLLLVMYHRHMAGLDERVAVSA